MENKEKKMFRLVVLTLIITLLLIPLMSSPVAASLNYNCSGFSEYSTSGITVIASCPEPYFYIHHDGETPVAVFYCSYTYKDINPSGTGSNHWVILTVDGPTPALSGSHSSTWLTLSADEGTKTYDDCEVQITYDPNTLPIEWVVTVTVLCLPVGGTMEQDDESCDIILDD